MFTTLKQISPSINHQLKYVLLQVYTLFKSALEETSAASREKTEVQNTNLKNVLFGKDRSQY